MTYDPTEASTSKNQGNFIYCMIKVSALISTDTAAIVNEKDIITNFVETNMCVI